MKELWEGGSEPKRGGMGTKKGNWVHKIWKQGETILGRGKQGGKVGLQTQKP